MYWADHQPPHFHAEYSGDQAQVRIDPVGLLRGRLPPRMLAMVVEWAALHREELLTDWELTERSQGLHSIKGLP